MTTPRISILTGAAGTLGQAITRGLLAQGVVVVGVDKNIVNLQQMSTEFGETFHPVEADLSSEDEIDRCCTQIKAEHGPADILINNAGVISTDKFLETSLDQLRRIMTLNFESAYLMSQKLLPDMMKAGKGRIINVSSFAGRSGGLLAGTAYSLSKSAMIGLTFSLAREFGPKGISVNAVAPAFVRSPMMTTAFKTDTDEKNLIDQIPMRRLCEPEEVASAIIYLTSELAGFINGEVIDINGGIQCD